MEEVVYGSLGKRKSSIRVGPKRGFDNAIVSIGRKRVMVVTADPLSAIPHLGMRMSAWLSVHLIASDLATSGVAPEYASFSLNLPSGMTHADKRDYLGSLGRACEEIGVAIIAGHTGTYPGAGFTVVGGGTMVGFAKSGEYIDPSMARPGDAVVMTKGAAIEAASFLASSFPKRTEALVGRRLAERARNGLRKCSTVRDALTAATMGLGRKGVSSMHDATEGGVIGGLDEMATASGNSFVIDPRKIPVPAENGRVCSAFGMDPLTSLSEGTLLLTCNPLKVGLLRAKLGEAGIAASEIGVVARGSGLWAVENGRKHRVRLGRDGYWAAYAKGIEAGWV